MSRTTASVHVKNASRERFAALVVARMVEQGFEIVDDGGEREPNLRRLLLRREGDWIALADEEHAELDRWGSFLSVGLDAPVLTLSTWDGEASVAARRFERGRVVASLELLDEARPGEDGRPRAPANAFEPWLREQERARVLRDGFVLASRVASTGDPYVDAMLEAWDDPEVTEQEDGHVFVPIEVSIASIADLIDLPASWIDLHEACEGDLELLFAPAVRVEAAGAKPARRVRQPKIRRT